MALGRKDVTVTRTNGGADIFRLAGLFGDDNLIRHQGLVWWTGFADPERIVNHRPTASILWAGLLQGGKTVEKRHRLVRRAGAVVEAACGVSANPYYSVQRFYRVSEARDAPDRDRLSLVSNAAISLAGIELSQRGADAPLGPPARLAIPPSYPNSGIFR